MLKWNKSAEVGSLYASVKSNELSDGSFYEVATKDFSLFFSLHVSKTGEVLSQSNRMYLLSEQAFDDCQHHEITGQWFSQKKVTNNA